MAKVIKIGAGYSDPVPIFHLKRIKKSDENAFLAEHAGVKGTQSDEEREQKQYEICVDAIANWSVEKPTYKKGEEEVAFFEGESNAADDVRRIFKEAEENGDDVYRTADLVIYHYRLQLQPEVLFP